MTGSPNPLTIRTSQPLSQHVSVKYPSLYFNWLQKDNPTGVPDRFPELKNKFETTVPGIYCTGDLTGIPLIKLAVESGHELIDRFNADAQFTNRRSRNNDPNTYDFVIIGAGPSGLAAGLNAQKHGYRFVIIESSRTLNTIVNFPKGKPIYVTPAEPPFASPLSFSDGTKESLLEELGSTINQANLPIHENEMVQQIVQVGDQFEVVSAKARYKALRVIVSIGKTGNARLLGVPGENLPKVFTRLIDPGEHHNEDILVVGGGDSALESANALAEAGNRVTLSYRKPAFSRPKEQNIEAFTRLTREKRIRPMLGSTVEEVRESEVILNTEEGQKVLPNRAVYASIGTEVPIQFFRRSNIAMEGERNFAQRMMFAGLLLFASVLYFGKSAGITEVSGLTDFLAVPGRLLAAKWPSFFKGLMAWISFIGMVGSGTYIGLHVFRKRSAFFTNAWSTFKYSYYAAMFFVFGFLYLSHNLSNFNLAGWVPWKWYTAMYSLTIVVFGLRRIHVNPTGYIKRQTLLLMAIQVFPLFVFPLFLFPMLGDNGWLGTWVTEHVFPHRSYWRSFGFVLAWPLSLHNLALNRTVPFWLVFSLVQTFVVIPYIVYRWGKGAYCGWICSCGALAETLGDEYRTKAPHGPTAKKWDNVGQAVLWFAVIVTAMVITKTWFGVDIPGRRLWRDIYNIVVDIVFAGVLGVGVYFFMSGRVWCRFLCPLAALMHIYARFSVYRIFSNKKRCISCNVCTKVCHMGIDVMGYANKGIPMNDVECVRCSACVVNCPMQVLTFGRTEKIDVDNRAYKQHHMPLTPGWQSGLPEKDIRILLEDEGEKHPELPGKGLFGK